MPEKPQFPKTLSLQRRAKAYLKLPEYLLLLQVLIVQNENPDIEFIGTLPTQSRLQGFLAGFLPVAVRIEFSGAGSFSLNSEISHPQHHLFKGLGFRV